MPRKKNCKVTNSNISNAQQHVNKTHSEIEIEIDNLIDNDFGRVMGDESIFNNTIQEKTNNIRKHQSTISLLRKNKPAGWSKELKKTKEKLKRARIDLNDAKKSKRDFIPKQKLAKDITELLKQRMYLSAVKSSYAINVPKIVGALKSFLTQNTGVPFISLADLDRQTLNLKYRQLKKWFDEQDNGIVPKGFYGSKGNRLKGAYEYTLADPAKVVLYRDKSLSGVALERDIQDVLAKKSSKKVKYKDKYNRISADLVDFIDDNNIIYFPDPANQPENPKKLTTEETAENIKNVVSLQADLMDGRTKYIEPRPSKDLIVKKQVMLKYNEIISYANRSGFNISKDIHEIEVAGETYYYVTMKESNVKGEEVYSAYLAPHYINESGQTVFDFPLTRKTGKLNGKWVAAINKAQNSNQDIVDFMKPGFRQAQIEKVFNGYNKFNKEINVKGYADYQPIDLSIDNPMFKLTRIRPGSKTVASVSVWKNVKDTRKLLADVFEDWQSMTTNTLKRIEKATARFPELKAALITKGVVNADATLNGLTNIIDFGQVIYMDEDGNVKSPNITTGIKENYHPNMYDTNVQLADLTNAINEMENEVELINDKITQLKYKKTQTTDAKEISKIKASIIRGNNKLLLYLGDGKDNEGLIKIMTAELKQKADEISHEDMPNVNAQSMVAYGKHRKLYTNSLKSTDPGVKYGGRRKDGKVIPDYITAVFDTAYNNDLKASLLETAPLLDPDMLSYLVEEVKAALGRQDLKAGLPFLDYSNERVVNMLKKVMPGATVEKLQAFSQNINMMISGALLGVNTGLGNRMQSPFSSFVEIGSRVEPKVINIINNNPEYALEIGQATGALDTVQAIADVFLGGMESQADFFDGLHSKKDILLLQGQNMLAFIDNAKGIRRQMLNLIKKKEGEDTFVPEEQIDLILKGIWEVTHGIAEGTLTKKTLKSIEKKLKRVAVSKKVKIFVNWGLNVFGVGKISADLQGVTQYLSMIEGEYEMRKIVALRAAIYYADEVIGGDMAGKYLHPDSIAFARQVINNTMFQFSLQNFSKAKRGAVGTSTMKFKDYYVKQTTRELKVFNNFCVSCKGLPAGQIRDEILKVLTPTENMPIPYLNRFIGYDKDSVGGFNLSGNGPFPHMSLPTGSGAAPPTEMFRQFIWTRGITSLITVGLEHLSIYKKVLRMFAGKGGGISIQTLGRGGEATSISTAIRLLMLVFATKEIGEDEEDPNAQQLWRIAVPIYINFFADLVNSGDPLKIFSIYGKWTHDFLDYVRGDND